MLRKLKDSPIDANLVLVDNLANDSTGERLKTVNQILERAKSAIL